MINFIFRYSANKRITSSQAFFYATQSYWYCRWSNYWHCLETGSSLISCALLVACCSLIVWSTISFYLEKLESFLQCKLQNSSNWALRWMQNMYVCHISSYWILLTCQLSFARSRAVHHLLLLVRRWGCSHKKYKNRRESNYRERTCHSCRQMLLSAHRGKRCHSHLMPTTSGSSFTFPASSFTFTSLFDSREGGMQSHARRPAVLTGVTQSSTWKFHLKHHV